MDGWGKMARIKEEAGAGRHVVNFSNRNREEDEHQET